MGEKNKNKAVSMIKMLIKIAVAAVIILWLYRNQQFAQWQDVLRDFKYPMLIPALLFSVTGMLFTGLRWRELMLTIGIKLSRIKAVSLTFQGMFFSLVIPGGAIGGDVIKMAAVTGCIQKGTRTEGVFSIVMDRIVGMIALFSVALVLLFFNRELFCDLPITGSGKIFAGMAIWWIFAGACGAGLLAGCALFFHRQIFALPLIRQTAEFVDRKSNGKISRIFSSVDLYRRNRDRLLLWILLTIVTIHLTPAIAMIFLLAGSGCTFLPPTTIFTAVIIGNIAGLIPLFPGGIGARDAVTIALLTAGGCPPDIAAATQLISTLLLILCNLSGAGFFIFDRKPEAEK